MRARRYNPKILHEVCDHNGTECECICATCTLSRLARGVIELNDYGVRRDLHDGVIPGLYVLAAEARQALGVSPEGEA